MSKIVRALSYSKDPHRRVKEVITNYNFTILVGGKYNPQRKSCINATAIEDRSHVQQMVCNYIESGVSLTEAQPLVSMWHVKHGERTLTHLAVVSCTQRINKRVLLIKKYPQGHTDPQSNWACCQFCLAAHIFLCFGKDLGEHQHQHLLNKSLDKTGDLPACFDPDLLPNWILTSLFCMMCYDLVCLI